MNVKTRKRNCPKFGTIISQIALAHDVVLSRFEYQNVRELSLPDQEHNLIIRKQEFRFVSVEHSKRYALLFIHPGEGWLPVEVEENGRWWYCAEVSEIGVATTYKMLDAEALQHVRRLLEEGWAPEIAEQGWLERGQRVSRVF